MSIKVIQEKLQQYQPQNQLEEEHALKEITQEIALASLSRSEFFKIAAFQGGTCLRIMHGLNRFSEDLDFALLTPDITFSWSHYLQELELELKTYGYQLEILDRSETTNAVKIGFLKDDSIAKVLLLQHQGINKPKALKIKFEIDTNPPNGSNVEQKYLEFPVITPVVMHDLPSLFAGKSHALLCRPFEKGRDWYDFSWYISKKVSLNYEFLAQALQQMGPFQGKDIRLNKAWYFNQLEQRIQTMDWQKQKQDILRFVKNAEREFIQANWNTDFFMTRLEKLKEYLNDVVGDQ